MMSATSANNKIDVFTNGLVFRTGKNELLVVENVILKILYKYQQLKIKQNESGGLIFARIEKDLVKVVHISEPQKKDNQSRFRFIPSLELQQNVINKMFSKNLHYIGEWHTHPEKYPTPSPLDIESMSNCYKKSHHQLGYMVMIIIGTSLVEKSLWISLHNLKGYKKIEPLNNG